MQLQDARYQSAGHQHYVTTYNLDLRSGHFSCGSLARLLFLSPELRKISESCPSADLHVHKKSREKVSIAGQIHAIVCIVQSTKMSPIYT